MESSLVFICIYHGSGVGCNQFEVRGKNSAQVELVLDLGCQRIFARFYHVGYAFNIQLNEENE